jgi:plasmid maintenance system antidote protein VapI
MDEMNYITAILSVTCGIVSAVIWWGFRRMIHEQDRTVNAAVTGQSSLAVELHNLALSLAKICGNVERSVMWQELHDKQDQERHDSNTDAHKELTKEIMSLRDRDRDRQGS